MMIVYRFPLLLLLAVVGSSSSNSSWNTTVNSYTSNCGKRAMNPTHSTIPSEMIQNNSLLSNFLLALYSHFNGTIWPMFKNNVKTEEIKVIWCVLLSNSLRFFLRYFISILWLFVFWLLLLKFLCAHSLCVPSSSSSSSWLVDLSLRLLLWLNRIYIYVLFSPSTKRWGARFEIYSSNWNMYLLFIKC